MPHPEPERRTPVAYEPLLHSFVIQEYQGASRRRSTPMQVAHFEKLSRGCSAWQARASLISRVGGGDGGVLGFIRSG
jgi:hypothetical protein